MSRLFSPSQSCKQLRRIKGYDHLEAALQRLGSSVRLEEITRTGPGRVIYGLRAGNPAADHRVLLTAANHGREDAPPLTLLLAAQSFANPNEPIDALLDRAQVLIIPCLDPDGYDCRGVKCVDPVGNCEILGSYIESTWSDANSIWCRADEFLPSETRHLKQYMQEFAPTLAFDLHETLPDHVGSQLPFMGNRRRSRHFETVIIEFLPERQEGLKERPGEPIGAGIIRGLKSSFYAPRRVSAVGRLVRGLLMPLPQTITKSEGREASGPLLTAFRKGVMVLSDWLSVSFNIAAFTFETFSAPLDYRVGAHLAGLEGGLRALLGLAWETPRFIDRQRFARHDDFHLQCCRLAHAELGDYHLTVAPPASAVGSDYLIAWNDAYRLEFRRRFRRLELKRYRLT